MTYAQVKNGIVQNRIVVEEDSESNIKLFLEGYDHCVRIDNLNPQPDIGWSYDGALFSPPEQLNG